MAEASPTYSIKVTEPEVAADYRNPGDYIQREVRLKKGSYKVPEDLNHAAASALLRKGLADKVASKRGAAENKAAG